MHLKLLASSILLLGLTSGLWAQADWPRSVKDAQGFSVTLKAKPQAIVSLTLATDEILFEMVNHARLKAITFLASDVGISNIAAAAWSVSFQRGTARQH